MVQHPWQSRQVSGDPDFDNKDFRQFLTAKGASFDPRTARRHNKIESVESSNGTIRMCCERLYKDAMFYRQIHGTQFSFDEILSGAIFLKSDMYGSKTLSSFEIAEAYTPALAGLPKQSVTEDLRNVHLGQEARRALQK